LRKGLHVASLKDLIDHLDALLDPSSFADFGPNGLQVPGREEVETVATGVSATAELFERAAQAGADLVLTHHGLFWDGTPRALDRPARRRLQLLFDADMSLAAYHLPLDGHPEVGNNALIAEGLGCESWAPFAEHRGTPIGVAGRFAGGGMPRDDLVGRVRELTAREPLAFLDGPDPVRTIGIVSGAGASYLGEAIVAGYDAFLTGEPAERVMAQAREAGITFVAAGHYATETFGVRALGDRLAAAFGVRHIFIDLPNPV
jgi:dinuclear metal center YbgI/SA1388 family protein